MPVSQQLESLFGFALSALLLAGVAVIVNRAVSSNPGHHSIPWEAKKPLIERYGTWAVNRAEAFCPENDVACVAREARRLYEVYQSRRGI